jgi:hypothetical protein
MAFACTCGKELVVLVPSRLIDASLDPEEARRIDVGTAVNVALVAEEEGGVVVDGRKAPVSCPNCGDPIDLRELAGLSVLREAVHAG